MFLKRYYYYIFTFTCVHMYGSDLWIPNNNWGTSCSFGSSRVCVENRKSRSTVRIRAALPFYARAPLLAVFAVSARLVRLFVAHSIHGTCTRQPFTVRLRPHSAFLFGRTNTTLQTDDDSNTYSTLGFPGHGAFCFYLSAGTRRRHACVVVSDPKSRHSV